MTKQHNQEQWMTPIPGWHPKRILQHKNALGCQTALIEDETGSLSILYSLDPGPSDPASEVELQTRIKPPGTAQMLIRISNHEGFGNIPGIVSIREIIASDQKLQIRTDAYLSLDRMIGTLKHFTPKEVASLGMALCAGLQQLHERSLIHGNLQPSEVFLTAEEKWLLGNPLTAPLKIPKKKPSAATMYWAPEQFEGHSDHRSDIYSLGLLLYQILNENRLPFQLAGTPLEEAISLRSINKPFPIPQDVDPELGAVLQKACAFDPQERYQSAEEFWHALGGCMQAYHLNPSQKNSSGSNPTARSGTFLGITIILFAASAFLLSSGILSIAFSRFMTAWVLIWGGMAFIPFLIRSFKSLRITQKASKLAAKKDYEGALNIGLPDEQYQHMIVESILRRSFTLALTHRTRNALVTVRKAKKLFSVSPELEAADRVYSKDFEAETLLASSRLTAAEKSEEAVKCLRDALVILPDSIPLKNALKDHGETIKEEPVNDMEIEKWLRVALFVLFLSVSTFGLCRFADLRNDLLQYAQIYSSEETVIKLRRHPWMLKLSQDVGEAYDTACENHITEVVDDAQSLILENQFLLAIDRVNQALQIHPEEPRLLDALELIRTPYVDTVLEAAAGHESEQHYIDAFSTVCAGLQSYPDDVRLREEKSRLYPFYIQRVEDMIRDSLDIYDYDAALELMDQANALLPTDEKLHALETYLEEIRPATLSALDIAGSSNWNFYDVGHATFKDNVEESSITCHTDGRYELLTMYISGFYVGDIDNRVCVNVYGDEQLLYSTGWFDDTCSGQLAEVDIAEYEIIQITVTNENVDISKLFTVRETIRLKDIQLWETKP